MSEHAMETRWSTSSMKRGHHFIRGYHKPEHSCNYAARMTTKSCTGCTQTAHGMRLCDDIHLAKLKSIGGRRHSDVTKRIVNSGILRSYPYITLQI